jgi:hypothetical protein
MHALQLDSGKAPAIKRKKFLRLSFMRYEATLIVWWRVEMQHRKRLILVLAGAKGSL